MFVAKHGIYCGLYPRWGQPDGSGSVITLWTCMLQQEMHLVTYAHLQVQSWGQASTYLASLLHFSNIPRQLRSSTSQQLSIPRIKLNLGKRAFSVAAPIIWNELPTTLKSCERLSSFRKNLKTYLFKIAFPP